MPLVGIQAIPRPGHDGRPPPARAFRGSGDAPWSLETLSTVRIRADGRRMATPPRARPAPGPPGSGTSGLAGPTGV